MAEADTSRLALAQQFIDALPHAKALGLKLETMDDTEVTVRLPYDPRLVGDPGSGVLHGGAISALMDTTCGTVVMMMPEGFGTATLDLRIDYMRAATPGQGVRAVAQCYHVTRSVAFVRATAYDEDASRPVAGATGAFTYGHSRAPSSPEEMAAAMAALETRKKELGL